MKYRVCFFSLVCSPLLLSACTKKENENAGEEPEPYNPPTSTGRPVENNTRDFAQSMIPKIIGLVLLLALVNSSYAQQPPVKTNKTSVRNTLEQQEVINLSKKKWDWMADKSVDSLNILFDDRSMFVHMGGSWGKEQEINVIKSGSIWYKKAEVYSVTVNMFGNTAILLNDIDLEAVVGGNTVTNPFMVTEVYIKQNGKWKMGSLTFSKLMRPVKMNNPSKEK